MINNTKPDRVGVKCQVRKMKCAKNGKMFNKLSKDRRWCDNLRLITTAMSSSSSLRWDSAVSSTAPDVMSSMTVASIDLTRVEAIQKKRLVTFVNHFIARTVRNGCKLGMLKYKTFDVSLFDNCRTGHVDTPSVAHSFSRIKWCLILISNWTGGQTCSKCVTDVTKPLQNPQERVIATKVYYFCPVWLWNRYCLEYEPRFDFSNW